MTQTITVVSGNLWQIAAQYMGDAQQGSRIAALNGLSDPMITGPVTLVIPAPDATQSGGLPPS